MIEKPSLQEYKIIDCLKDNYEIIISQIDFLPIGADSNTAVYRADAENGASFFVKLRKGNFDETAVTLPKHLSDHGISNIIPPLATKTSQLWTNIEAFKLILYPFIEGRDGFSIDLSNRHWFEFGTALHKLHTTEIPSSIKNKIQREEYPRLGREMVKKFVQLAEEKSFSDPVAIELAAFLKIKRNEIIDLVNRAERLALKLQTDLPAFTICHSDVHAGNILIDNNDKLYIVDWDNPILAPKERDLMFPGGAQGFNGHTLEDEEILFYRGYGQTDVNQTALAYYRYERIIQDIAVYCEELLLSDKGGEDRKQSLQYLKSNFLPNKTIEAAYRSDNSMK